MHDYGDRDDAITRPETPAALRARSGEQLAGSAESIRRAIPLLELLDGADREYFASRLADDIESFADGARDLAAAVRFAGNDTRKE